MVYDLEPHWETTLQQAMEEDPPPIAQITYQPFGIRGRLENVDDATVDRIVLDDLDDADIRRAYRESLRNDAVMEDAIRFFLTELGNRRRDPRQAKVAGIVFVGNHESEFDKWENEHAVRVKTFLNQLSPRLRCEIIVSSDQSAQNLLDEFLGREGGCGDCQADGGHRAGCAASESGPRPVEHSQPGVLPPTNNENCDAVGA